MAPRKINSSPRLSRSSPQAATATLLVLAAALAVAAIGPIHARLYGHDIFFLLDNGWRALLGQRVHLDYSSALGPLTFLLVAAALALSSESVAAITYASAFFAALSGLWCIWLTAARPRSPAAPLLPLFATLLAAAPFALGDPPTLTSQGMVYNRYGYALLTILILECFLPPVPHPGTPSPRRPWLEPALTGAALSLLLFLKVSYFLVALPLLGIALPFRPYPTRRALAHALGFATTSLAFMAYLRFDYPAMLQDLQMASAARAETLGLGRSLSALAAGALIRALPLAAIALWCRRSLAGKSTPESLWNGWCYPLAALLIPYADTLFLLTNAQVPSYPLTAAYALVLLISIEPPSPPFPALLASAALLAFPMLALQLFGLGYALFESKRNLNPPGIARFESPRLHPLVLYDIAPDDMDRFANGRHYVESIDDGLRLLTLHTRPSDKITTLDMANPFPFALSRQPVNGGIGAPVYGFTLNENHHPTPERLFADSSVVMVPKFPASPPLFYDGFRRIYEPALQSHFRLEAESSHWQLFRSVRPF